MFQKKFESHCDYIGHVNYKEDEYNLSIDDDFEIKENKPVKSIDDKLWLVIKKTVYNDNLGYKLREGDVIKLGKVMFKVKELKSEERQERKAMKLLLKEKTNVEVYKSSNNVNRENVNIELGAIPVKKKRGPAPICRICLMDDNETENPLINPCHCIGSVRYIHLLCIRQWLKSKVTSKNFNFLTVHSFKNNFECEICKATIPEKIKFRNDILYLVDYQKPDTNFIMLESISREKRETKYFYIIHMHEKNVIKLGRSNDSDVRMTDISVSRNHAFLKLFKGDFYLEDNASKFGTLTQIQNDFVIIPNKPIALQSGKLFLIFSLQKTCFAWIRCYSNNKLQKMDYNDHFELKFPFTSRDELENLPVVNTDYTVTEGNSMVKQSEKAQSVKEMIDYETFIYKQIEKDLKELKEDLHNEMLSNYGEEPDEHIVGGEIDENVMENDQNYTSINFKTGNNNDNSVHKLVLTENSRKGDGITNYNSEKVKRNIRGDIPIPMNGVKNENRSNKSAKVINKYNNIPNTSSSGIQIDKEGSHLFPSCFNEGSCINERNDNASRNGLNLLNSEKDREDYQMTNSDQFNSPSIGGYNSNQNYKHPLNLDEIARLNTYEDQIRNSTLPKSTKYKKVEYFKLKTSGSIDKNESKPEEILKMNKQEEIIPFKLQKFKTNMPNNDIINKEIGELDSVEFNKSYHMNLVNLGGHINKNISNNVGPTLNILEVKSNHTNNDSKVLKTGSQYESNENEVVKVMIDNLFGNLPHYNSNSQSNFNSNKEDGLLFNMEEVKENNISETKITPPGFELNNLKLDIESVFKEEDDQNNIEDDEYKVSKNNFFSKAKLKENNTENKSEFRKRLRKMSDSSLPSSRNHNFTNVPVHPVPILDNNTARKNSSSSFITHKSGNDMNSRRSMHSIHNLIDF